MCGRYYIEIDDRELQNICDAVQKKQQEEETGEQLEIKLCGEIFPTDIVAAMTGLNEYRPMKWGFGGFDKKPLINARSETALTKPAFKESMYQRRCLIPASGYYEWKKDGNKKIKHQIHIPGQAMYFAGCYKKDKGEPLPRFVILTRAAAHGLEEIHERMPVIIPKKFTRSWLHDNAGAMAGILSDSGADFIENVIMRELK